MKMLILENIRSAYNVGSIFRTADAAGVDLIYLVGYTPSPIDRFGREQAEICKTSLGASTTLPWQHVDTVDLAIMECKKRGVQIVVVELHAEAIPLQDFLVPDQIAYILGNEVTGVSAEALTQADTIVAIPMLGQKESLNVSVAAGIILYHGLST